MANNVSTQYSLLGDTPDGLTAWKTAQWGPGAVTLHDLSPPECAIDEEAVGVNVYQRAESTTQVCQGWRFQVWHQRDGTWRIFDEEFKPEWARPKTPAGGSGRGSD